MKRLILLTAILAGCGSGGGVETREAPPKPVLVEAYGDSTMSASCDTISETSLTKFAEQAFLNVKIVNKGSCGATTESVMKDWDGAMQSSFDIVVMNYGINDSHSLSLDQYKYNLTTMVQIAKKYGKKVMLQTPNPSLLSDITLYIQGMKDVATEQRTELCDIYQADIDNNMNTNEFLPDGVHPITEMYKFEGGVLAECLKRMI